MEDWNTAGSVEVKENIIFNTPQIKSFVAPSTPLKNESANEVKSLHV
jgi:hypothetical protein